MESVPQSVSFELVPKFSANLPSFDPLGSKGVVASCFSERYFLEGILKRYFTGIPV